MLSYVPPQKKKRKKTTSATEMSFRDCLLSLPPCCWSSLLAATRLSVVSGWSDLDIFEFENHFCCLGHLLCLLLQLHGYLQLDRRVHGGIRREHCPCRDTHQCRWRSTSTRSTTIRIRSAALPPSTSSSTVGLDLMATRTTPGWGFCWIKANLMVVGGEGRGGGGLKASLIFLHSICYRDGGVCSLCTECFFLHMKMLPASTPPEALSSASWISSATLGRSLQTRHTNIYYPNFVKRPV